MLRHLWLWLTGRHAYLLPLHQPEARPFDQDDFVSPTPSLDRLSAQVIARAEEILQEADAE
jgi:hypothetical protein